MMSYLQAITSDAVNFHAITYEALLQWGLTLVIKPSLLLLVFLGVVRFSVSRSAASQHFLLSLSMWLLLLFSVAVWLVPQLSIAITFSDTWLNALRAAVSIDILFWLTVIYSVVVFAMLYYLIIGLASIQVITRRAIACSDEMADYLQNLCYEMGINKTVSMKLSSQIQSPQVWGIWHPVILMPMQQTSWSIEKTHYVLIHELGHVVRYDWLTTLLVRIVSAIFWFNPLLWIASRQLFQRAESACDDYVHQQKKKHTHYADILLEAARQEQDRQQDALSIGSGSAVYQRIAAVLDEQRERYAMADDKKGYWFVLSTLVLLPFTALTPTLLDETMTTHAFTPYWLAPQPVDNVNVIKEKPLTVLTIEQLQEQFVVQRSIAGDIKRIEEMQVVVRRNLTQKNQRHIANSSSPKELFSEPNTAISTSPIELPPLANIQIEGYLPQSIHAPEYPLSALRKSIQGHVQVAFTINEQGTIQQPKIIESVPRAVFDSTVLEALVHYRFVPQRLNGQPVAVHDVQQTFTFRLAERKPNANLVKRR